MRASAWRYAGKSYLEGNPPAKDGKGNKQARIPLSLYASVPLDLEQAEAKAWELAACRTQGKFNWDNWLPSKGNEIANETPAAQVVEQYRQLKLQQGLKPEIWQRNYWYVYRKLDLDNPLTETSILAVIGKTAPNSALRKICYMRLQALAKFARLDIDLKPFMGNYSQAKTKSRHLPSDEEILAARACFLRSPKKDIARR